MRLKPILLVLALIALVFLVWAFWYYRPTVEYVRLSLITNRVAASF